MFKNVVAYHLTGSLAQHLGDLQPKLEPFQARLPGDAESRTQGFVPPEGSRPDRLHRPFRMEGGIQYYLRMRTSERLLPSAVVKEETAKRIAEIEEREDRKLGKKERSIVKDETIYSLLPKAFIKSTDIDAIVDPFTGKIFVNTSSTKRAEEFLTLLRKALGSLPAVPFNVKNFPAHVITDWVRFPDDMLESFRHEGRFVLREAGSTVKKARFVAYDASEIDDLVNNGQEAIEVSLEWNDSLRFVLTEDLRLKSLKDTTIKEDSENEDAFEAEALLTYRLLSGVFKDLAEAFGGERYE